ncbi:HAD family hydrolase [Crassaminicella indica]|uniref:HAD-IA family hydrolase n=1 Tax=Crassaminicella indica TaxID=2855394 RepID=A0ABX8RD25_9CLOT|nr:HAD-IA family hydrolase [Crassaminicella indica]QXM06671.1 HAD-IA family hydrolase [Crassaminicella indica]
MIKGIVFDLDDTLISERAYVFSGFKEVAKKIGQDYGLNENKLFFNMKKLFEKDTKHVFNRLLDAYRLDYTIDYIKKLIVHYREHIPNIRLYDDAEYTLKYLYSKKFKLGMITDGYQNTQRNKLKVLDIEKYFDIIVITDEIGRDYWKPHKKPYEMVKEKLDLEYAEMIYIGDNINKDFVMANELGMETVMICREDGIYKKKEMDEGYYAKYNIRSLIELIDMFRF